MMLDNMERDFENNQQKRDLGQDQDLQLAFDHNLQFEDKDLQDKVLFAIQGLGSIRTIQQNGKHIEAYIKGQHCQQSIKDLVKFIRGDAPENPKVKMILSHYNIVETDLIELLLLQVEDKKLSFWLVALLALITSKPSDQLIDDDKQQLYNALRQYKHAFVKHQCLTILTVHIADYFKTPVQSRQKAHYQMLEFIILLIRNLLQTPDSKADPQSLHNHFLATLIREEMFNPLLYLIQNQKGEIMNKIDIPLLEIFYYSFTCFDPEMMFKSKKSVNYMKLVNQAKLAQGPTPLRHSRFQPLFCGLSDVGVKRINHNLHKKSEPIQNQRKIPRRTVQLKKVERIQQQYFAQNFMQMQFQMIENQTKRTITRKIGQIVFELSQQFVEVEFPQLSQLVFSQIYKQSAKITTNNIIQYLLLCNWAIRMTRAKFHKQKVEAKNHVQAQQVEFDLGQIANIMQTAHFELIYKTLFKEATRQKKKNFKINTFNGAMKLFQNYLNVINDISLSMMPNDRKNATALMANMFRHDIARIFKIGFLQITHQGILATIISVCHKFYKLLSKYSNGKVLTIQTNKLLKKKNNKKQRRMEQEQDMQGFISQDSQDNDDDSKSYHEGDQDKPQEKQKVKKNQKQQEQQRIPASDQPMFQERKFNEISEFAIIAEYDIISKYLIFLKDEKILKNTDQFNDSLFFYFEQICKLLKGQWLFFQAETLCVFQSILSVSSQLVRKNKKNIDKIRFVKKICQQFLKLLKNNRLALVQSLFHYPNLSLKQKILKNYQDGYDAGQQVQQNMFHDDDKQDGE